MSQQSGNESMDTQLARMDERTRQILATLTRIEEQRTRDRNDLDEARKQLRTELMEAKSELIAEIDKRVTLARFTPVEKLVYGSVGILLGGVMMAVLGLLLPEVGGGLP